jgi:hypothetical protein
MLLQGIVVCIGLYYVVRITEGFKASGPQCGLGLQGCSQDEKCMNGYCDSLKQPCLPKNELDVYP